MRGIHPRRSLLDEPKRMDDLDGVICSRGPKGKFSIERSVCAPQYESAGTSIGPKLSVSVRVLVLGMESSFVMPTFSGIRLSVRCAL